MKDKTPPRLQTDHWVAHQWENPNSIAKALKTELMLESQPTESMLELEA